MSDCCLTTNENFVSYIMARTRYIRRDDNDVGFVLDQHVSVHGARHSPYVNNYGPRSGFLYYILKITPPKLRGPPPPIRHPVTH